MDKLKNIIQIAGIQDQAEAEMLMSCGVDWLGFPLRLAYHKEDLSEAVATEIIRNIRHPHAAVVITYLTDPDEIISFCEALAVSKVQLHNDLPVASLQAVKARKPELFVMKSLVVRADNTNELASAVDQFSPFVDAFLTDTFDPQTGATGATGKTHDWRVSRKLVEMSQKPVILAGGLTLENVGEGIRQVRPAGVDAHTGVEGRSGRKDRDFVSRFVAEARAAFAGFEEEEKGEGTNSK